MKHRPILFSTAMVQAILDGRKTQTRRVVKPQPAVDEARYDGTSDLDTGGKLYHFLEHIEQGQPTERYYNLGQCPYGQPGDVLWVRETWDYGYPYAYKADGGNAIGKWRPSIHMPRSAARLFLRIKSIRVERLTEISKDDAIAEGIKSRMNAPINAFGQPFLTFYDYSGGGFPTFGRIMARDSFRTLWQSINGPESWEANPWVWVVEFERITREEAGL